MNDKQPLKRRLVHRVPLILPGFEKFSAIGAPRYDAPAVVLTDKPRDPAEWYGWFRDRILSTVGTGRHLPIYRMSHGEFIAMVGYRDPPVGKLRRMVSRLLGRQGAFKSGDAPYGWEQYTREELVAVRSRLPALIRDISQKGMLAIALHPENPGYARFLGPTLDYMDREGIDLNDQNYCPFYFVYALVLGSDQHALLKGRHVLVVTGPTHGKRERLDSALRKLGAKEVCFLPCHPNKSMFDVLHVDSFKGKVDLALIGAGVGTANVLEQLEPLGVVCIDVGYCLSVLVDPSLPRRAYALPDAEWDSCKLADVTEQMRRTHNLI